MATQQRERNSFTPGTTSAAESVKDMAKDAGGKAESFVKDAASAVAQKSGDAASYVAHKTEECTTSMGRDMKSLAGTIRSNVPHEGMLGTAGSAVANTLETYGRELEEHGLGGIADDITNTVRRHPVPAIMIGIGLGFLLARTFAK